MMLQERY